MDGFSFDALTRSLTTAGSRRRALVFVLSGLLAPLLAGEATDAHNALTACKKKSGKKKKKCLKKAKKHNAKHASETALGGTCTPRCAATKPCGPNGCNGSCGSCVAPETCQNGRCRCTPDCNGKTCGGDGCSGTCGLCINGTCTEDQCVCAPDATLCGGNCVGPCGGSTVFDPVGCTCCIKSGEFCTEGEGNLNGTCCTGVCDADAPDPMCMGRFEGAPCHLAEQCIYEVCTDGVCRCPSGLTPCGGGGCTSGCDSNSFLRPGTCDCCTRNGIACEGGFCCAGPHQCAAGGGVCAGLDDRAVCEFNEQCQSQKCEQDCSDDNICTVQKFCQPV